MIPPGFDPGREEPSLAGYRYLKGLLKMLRRGETTPFIADLCSDYARLLIGFPALSTPRLAPTEYPARLPF